MQFWARDSDDGDATVFCIKWCFCGEQSLGNRKCAGGESCPRQAIGKGSWSEVQRWVESLKRPREAREKFPSLDFGNLAKYCRGKLQHNPGGGTPYRTYRRKGKVRSPPKKARDSDDEIEVVKRESEDDEGQSSTDVSSTESERGLRGNEVDQDDEEPEEMVDMRDDEIDMCSAGTAAIREEVKKRRESRQRQQSKILLCH